jgi:hypothetical protein
MKLLSGLFLRLFLGLLAAMGLIRVLETDKSPAALVGWTLLATALIYGVGWLRPRDLQSGPPGEQGNRKPAREDLSS